MNAYSDNITRLMRRHQPYKFDIDDRPISTKSIDTFELTIPIEVTCPSNNRPIESDVAYINPRNNQVYLLCPKCKSSAHKWKAWHLVTGCNRDAILDNLSLSLDKYHKRETEEEILSIVIESPGINLYQISQDLEMTKGRTRRGVFRLKKKHLVRTRHVGKAICVYPIMQEIGTVFTINRGD